MAFNYEDQGDFITACYFYNKVIDIAASCKVSILKIRINNFNLLPCLDLENATTNRITKIKQYNY